MFFIVTQRPELSGRWRNILLDLGPSHDLPDLQSLATVPQSKHAQLVVIDYRQVAGLPVSVLEELHGLLGTTRLVLADTHFDPARELAALATGVAACCDVALQPPDLARIVDIVLHGGVWISREALPSFISRLREASGRPRTGNSSVEPDTYLQLTERQREVAALVGKGASNKQIARQLDITDRTVKAHLSVIFEKLGISDRVQLALYINNRSR